MSEADAKRDAPWLEVVAVAGLATVQDRGRPGRMHEGVPPGGPLVPAFLARANATVENDPGEAGLEVFGSLSVVVHGNGPLSIATDEGRAIALGPGDRFDLHPSKAARVRYLAVRGGIDVPVVLGGLGTLLVAGMGGLEGRPLRRGDRLAVGSVEQSTVEKTPLFFSPPDARPIHVHLGPDHDAFSADAAKRLLSATFMVSPASDRIGTRLIGPTLPHAAERDASTALSAPMVRGAIEVTAAGEAIVLGPDHPTTGGYPILAVIAYTDLGRFFATPVRGAIRFAPALPADQEITRPK